MNLQEIGALIEAKRKATGLRRIDIDSDTVGISWYALRHIEKGQSTLTHSLMSVCEALGLEVIVREKQVEHDENQLMLHIDEGNRFSCPVVGD